MGMSPVRFGQLVLNINKVCVNPAQPFQISLYQGGALDDRIVLTRNEPSNLLDRNAGLAALCQEIRALGDGATTLPDWVRERLVAVIQSIQPNDLNQRPDTAEVTEMPKGHATAWEVFNTQRDTLIALLKNPAYGFKKSYMGFQFVPQKKASGWLGED